MEEANQFDPGIDSLWQFPSLTSNLPACSQPRVTAAMGNVVHRNKELWDEMHCQAGFGDLGWGLEKPEQQGDICLAAPAAETPSAWGSVPSAVNRQKWSLFHLNSGLKNTKIKPAT